MSNGFGLESVTALAPAVVAVRFTLAPLQVSPTGVNDALNVGNYVLSGPGNVTVVTAAQDPSDVQTIILTLNAPLVAGTWTLAASPNIQTPLGFPLTSPLSVAFAFVQPPQASVTPGTVDNTPEDFLRTFLSKALQGPGWDAVIAAVANGDQTNLDNAALAFDQLFISSASGIYLDRKLSDDGIRRPTGLGLGDEPFRRLGISIRNNQLTQEAILEVLQIFYGTDAVMAFAETADQEPYALQNGDTLEVLIDGIDPFTVTFQTGDFTNITQATAIEVAVAITQSIRAVGISQAFAIPQVNPQDGTATVRIYSGAIGLRSTVQVTGGRAQNALLFPEQLPLPVVGTTPSTLSWDINHVVTGVVPAASPNIMRVLLASGSLDLTQVRAGDYVNIFGVNFDAGNQGTFPILDVVVTYDPTGTTLYQYFDVQNFTITPQTGVVEVSLDDVRFYRPLKATIQAASGRTVVVDQSTPNVCDVIIPATTLAVQRMVDTGAYLHEATGLINPSAPDAWPIFRNSEGVVTVSATNHGLHVGSQIFVDDAVGSITIPAPAVGTPGFYPVPPIDPYGSGPGSPNETEGIYGNTTASPIAQFSLIRAGDQVISSQYSTAAFIPEAGTTQNAGPQYIGMQVGGHAFGQGLDLLGTSNGTAPHTYSFTAAHNPIQPLSVRLYYFGADGLTAVDDGVGNLVQVNNLNGCIITAGTVNYQTGVINFTTLAEPQGAQVLDLSYFYDLGTTAKCSLFKVITPVNELPETGGASSWSYTYAFPDGIYDGLYGDYGTSLPAAVERHAMSPVLTQGANAGGLVVGGGGTVSGATVTPSTAIYTYIVTTRTWATAPIVLSQARISLGAGLFSDTGKVVFVGGATTVNTHASAVTDITDVNQASISVGPNLNDARSEHQTVSFVDHEGYSKIMVIGGRALALTATLDTLVLGLWHLDETSGTSVADAGPNAYTLTASGPTVNAAGKINYCRNFVSAGTITGAGNATAVTTLLGPFTIEAWVGNVQLGTSGVAQTLVSYEGTAGSAGAGNILAQLNITYTTGLGVTLSCQWQNGTNVAVTSLSTGPYNIDTTVEWHHVAMTKALTPGSSTTYDVQFYLDGQPVGPLFGANANATGGSTSQWNLGGAVQSSQPLKGQLDDVRVSGGNPAPFLSIYPSATTRTPQDIFNTWLRGRGDYLTHGNGYLRASSEVLVSTSLGAWTYSGRMAFARSGHQAVVLPDGRIFVCGGYGYKTGETFVPTVSTGAAPPLSSAEIWDPSTQSWNPAGNMAGPRADHYAVYLPVANQVMVFGGFVDNLGHPGSLVYDLYDVKTGTWTTGPVPIPNTDVLVTQSGAGPAELFSPVLTNGQAVCMGSVWPTVLGNSYLIDDNANTVLHVNGAGLHNGTSRFGPPWSMSGNVPFVPGASPLSAVGPMGVPNMATGTVSLSSDLIYTYNGDYQLSQGNPLAFATGVSWTVTIIWSHYFPPYPNENTPAIITVLDDFGSGNPGWAVWFNEPGVVFWIQTPNASGADADNAAGVGGGPGVASVIVSGGSPGSGWTIPNETVARNQGGIGYGAYEGMDTTFNPGWPMGTMQVISFGYDASTNGMFLKVNGADTVTGNLGGAALTPGGSYNTTLGDGPPGQFPMWGQFFEVWASTDVPSDALFTSIYSKIVAKLAAANPKPMDLVWAAGALASGGNAANYNENAVVGDGTNTVYTYVTNSYPLIPGMVAAQTDGPSIVTDDGAGNMAGTTGGIAWTATIAYLTGIIVFTYASPPPGGQQQLLNYNAGDAPKGLVYAGTSGAANGGGLNGWQSVSAVLDDNTFQYETPAYPYYTENAGLTTVITPFAATPCGPIPGPYVYDTSGKTPGITSIQAVTAVPLYKGQQYESLPLSTEDVAEPAVPFGPFAPGYLVLNFGSDDQVFPVRYFGVFSESSLMLDYTFVMPFDVPAGSSVTLLTAKGVYVPAQPETVGSFYLTDSNAGRVQAEGVVESITAGGLNVDISVVYPGDRGLGGEGLPATGQKFSEKVLVWGSNDLDVDELDARLGINLDVEGT